MADPISISASIGGLITLADVVFSRTYKYVRAAKNAQQEISALSSELSALYGILGSVGSISHQLEGEVFETTTRLLHISACQKTLEDVRRILNRDSTSSIQDKPLESLKPRLHWPFKASEVKSLMKELERHKATFGLALNADGVTGLFRILSGQQHMNASLQDIHNELRRKREIDARVTLDKESQDILKTFGSIDHRRSHDMGRKLRYAGTGLWLIENYKFQHWLQSTDQTLWLIGIPGAGKTVLASVVIDEALPKGSPSHAIAYFYCDYKDQRTQEASGILGSLAQQISKQDEQSFAKLYEFHRAYGQGQSDTAPYEATLLRDLVRDVMTNFESTSIIIDALDECVGNVRDIVELLMSLGGNVANANVKLLFLSRDEIDIRDSLDASPQISIAADNRDLGLYVGGEIEERIRKKKLNIKNASLKGFMMDRLINGAEGMYVDGFAPTDLLDCDTDTTN